MSVGASLGAALGTLANQGRDKLTFILPPRWKSYGGWLEQLIAESTGKEGKGILPVPDEMLSDASGYGKDRVFVLFQNKNEAKPSAFESLAGAGHPVIIVKIHDDYDLSAQMFIWEMATAVAAHVMGVNPFDQPDVEATKKHTRAVIADLDRRAEATDEKPAMMFGPGEIFGNINGAAPAEGFRNFLKQAAAGDYICLQVFLSPSRETDEAVMGLRDVLARKCALPVTYGYGPRYLHSTGQLHKGDSGNGVFIQLTQDFSSDIDIPDKIGEEKSSLTFGALNAAQAKGDRQALTESGRRILRFHFRTNPVAGLKAVAEML